MNKKTKLEQLILEHTDAWVRVNKDFKIVEANKMADSLSHDGFKAVGGKCFEVLYGKTKPCSECPVGKDTDIPVIGLDDITGTLLEERIKPIEGGEFLINFRNESSLRNLSKNYKHLENLAVIGQLSSGIAHDFNNVLTGILGHTGSLKKSIKNKEHLEDLINIEKVARSGAATAFRIKSYASTKYNTDFEPVDLHRLLQEVVSFAQPRWKEKNETGLYKLNIDMNLQGSLLIWGNEHELRNALINIVFNSVDAMLTGGTIKVLTRISHDLAQITIQDTGIGMDKSTLAKMFTPFFTTKEEQGTGLGMIESKSIIENHNGNITVESSIGVGTTVKIRLPLSKTEKKAKTPAPSAPMGKYNILVFDDQEYILEVTKDILEEMGHTVSAWMEVSKGLEEMKNNQFNLVITDYGMKEMNGYEVAKVVKKFNKDLPVILMSGWAVDIDADEKMKKVIDLSLPKPFSIEELAEAIQKVIKN